MESTLFWVASTAQTISFLYPLLLPYCVDNNTIFILYFYHIALTTTSPYGKDKAQATKGKQAAFSSAPVPYPEKRAPGQRPPTHSVAHISENNAKHYLQMAFQHYLHGHIKSALKTYINKRQDLSDEVTTSILDAVLATNRSPRGIFVKADELA